MQHTCTPDPGSQPADCVGDEANLDLLTIGDFSQSQTAANLYAYTDSTAAITSFSGGWTPNTESNPFPRCSSQQPDRALHIQGGPFLGWGGGVGMGAKDLGVVPTDVPNGCSQPSDSLCVLSSEDYKDAEMDVSAYEGVALWARRGPDSQGGIRVVVADKYTEDDISYRMYQDNPARPRYCERVRECGCTNHQACQAWPESPQDMFSLNGPANNSSSCGLPAAQINYNLQPNGLFGPLPNGFFCGDPASGIVPGAHSTGAADFGCFTCGFTRCFQDYPAYPGYPPKVPAASLNDAEFNGKPCTPYTTRGGISSAYCFDPAVDPPPAESDQTCGDHWTTAIYLTNQWTLYLVPFNTMLQQGFGKKSPKMYLPGVTAVRLTWDGGFIDYWIGKIAFYRHKS